MVDPKVAYYRWLCFCMNNIIMYVRRKYVRHGKVIVFNTIRMGCNYLFMTNICYWQRYHVHQWHEYAELSINALWLVDTWSALVTIRALVDNGFCVSTCRLALNVMTCWYVLSLNKCNLCRCYSSCQQGNLCVDMSFIPECHDISTHIVVDKSTSRYISCNIGTEVSCLYSCFGYIVKWFSMIYLSIFSMVASLQHNTFAPVSVQ